MPKKNKYVGRSLDDVLKVKLKDDSFRRKFEKARLEISVGQMVRRIMKHRKLTVRQLATKAGISKEQVQRLKADKNVSLDTLAKVAAATDKKVVIDFK